MSYVVKAMPNYLLSNIIEKAVEELTDERKQERLSRIASIEGEKAHFLNHLKHHTVKIEFSCVDDFCDGA
mgnify:CR=1 FL=1